MRESIFVYYKKESFTDKRLLLLIPFCSTWLYEKEYIGSSTVARVRREELAKWASHVSSKTNIKSLHEKGSFVFIFRS